MKKLCSFFILCLCFLLSACEDSLKVRGASISEITSVGSSNYGVCVSFAQDSRLEKLGVDVQLRFEKTGEITFWEENQQKQVFNINEADVWYSLTNLIALSNEKEGQEEFVLHKDAVNHNYLFLSEKDNTISIRVVAGEVIRNSQDTGYILAETMPISDIFKLKIESKN